MGGAALPLNTDPEALNLKITLLTIFFWCAWRSRWVYTVMLIYTSQNAQILSSKGPTPVHQPTTQDNINLTQAALKNAPPMLKRGEYSLPDNHASSRLANVMGCIIRNGGYISPLVHYAAAPKCASHPPFPPSPLKF